jgi:bifunctional pyridoxal-dependent enzyme with beta-cystathionase and maltose regulon repressor activities
LLQPHNPCGKVFTASEYEHIAGLIRKHPNCIAITDEVYGKFNHFLAN